jgi:polar amino acid transport system substrate-binding protein
MRTHPRPLAVLATLTLALAACSSSGGGAASSSAASPAGSAAGSAASSNAASGSAATGSAAAGGSAEASLDPNSLLGKVMKAGKLVVSTDPNYAPQSFKNPDGSYSGFDIDVANELAKRLGNLKVDFVAPDFSAITAGGWGGRWDVSVGSMTITTDRQKVVDFSPPYYYTPAQMAASKASGITTIEGLAGKTVCAGAATTYLDWLQGKKLDFGPLSPKTSPPAGVKTVSQKTDADCAQLWAAGRNDFEGWLSAQPTVDGAIAAKQPLIKVGDPVYFEPLAIAVDKSGPNDTAFVAKLKEIVDAMHADGTLSALSMKWYKADLTRGPQR